MPVNKETKEIKKRYGKVIRDNSINKFNFQKKGRIIKRPFFLCFVKLIII